MKIHNHPLTAGLTPKPIYNPLRPNISHGQWPGLATTDWVPQDSFWAKYGGWDTSA